jgi:hypothetical protein
MDAAPEHSKLGQVQKRSTTHFERTQWTITVRDEIVEANVVVECIRSEIRLQVRTGKHGAKSITDG